MVKAAIVKSAREDVHALCSICKDVQNLASQHAHLQVAVVEVESKFPAHSDSSNNSVGASPTSTAPDSSIVCQASSHMRVSSTWQKRHNPALLDSPGAPYSRTPTTTSSDCCSTANAARRNGFYTNTLSSGSSECRRFPSTHTRLPECQVTIATGLGGRSRLSGHR